MRIFLLTWPKGRSILCFFCLSYNFLILGSVFDFKGGLFLLTLALIFGPLNPLTLVTSSAGSLWNLKKECNLSNQRLLQGFRSKGRARWRVVWDCTDIRVIVGFSLLPPL